MRRLSRDGPQAPPCTRTKWPCGGRDHRLIWPVCGDARAGGRAGRATAEEPKRLKDALRKARIEAAERTGVVVDLRDAEVARLELINEALDPLFAEIPPEVELFDRGISAWRDPAAMDRCHRPCRHGARQAHLPLRAGHPLRTQGAGRKSQHLRCGRGGDPICRAAAGRARARARRHERARARRCPPDGVDRAPSAPTAGIARLRLWAACRFAVLVAAALLLPPLPRAANRSLKRACCVRFRPLRRRQCRAR